MQTPELVGREAPPLLREVGGVSPRGHRGVSTGLGLGVRVVRICAEFRGVPREVHARILAALALRHEVEEGVARAVVDAGVRRDPGQRIVPRGIGRQRLEDVPVAIAVDLVEADKEIRLAVGADRVLGRQDLQRALRVHPLDLLLLHDHLSIEHRVCGDDLLEELEIIASLPLVIRQEKAVVTLRRFPGQEPIEPGEDEVRRLPVLLPAAGQREVVVRRGVLAEGVEGLGEDALAVGLDNVQEGPLVDPFQVREEFEGGDRHADNPLPSPARSRCTPVQRP